MTSLRQRPRATGSAYVDLVYAQVYGATTWRRSTEGVWATVQADAELDRALGVRGARSLARSLPADPVAAATVLLRLLDVPPSDRVRSVGAMITASAGWAAHVAWRLRQGVHVPGVTSSVPTEQRVQAYSDLLTLRLLDCLLHGTTPTTVTSAAESDADDEMAQLVSLVGAAQLRLAAWEHAVRAPILEAVETRARELAASMPARSATTAAPEAQVITCIDVRSERLRRQLEAGGPWETYGAAGFFGIPLRHVSPTGEVTERCPVLIRPGPHGRRVCQRRTLGMVDVRVRGRTALGRGGSLPAVRPCGRVRMAPRSTGSAAHGRPCMVDAHDVGRARLVRRARARRARH